MRKCNKCGEWKELEEFSKSSSRRERRQIWCKLCQSTHAKTYRLKPEIKISTELYRKTHKETHKRYTKNWYQNNKEIVKERGRLYRKNNKKARALVDKLYALSHKKEARMLSRKYRNELRDWYVRETIVRYFRKRKIEIGNITPEMIELKRKAITMYRTLKQFKQWREEYESSNADVYGKQFSDEENYGGRFSAKPNLISATGI